MRKEHPLRMRRKSMMPGPAGLEPRNGEQGLCCCLARRRGSTWKHLALIINRSNLREGSQRPVRTSAHRNDRLRSGQTPKSCETRSGHQVTMSDLTGSSQPPTVVTVTSVTALAGHCLIPCSHESPLCVQHGSMRAGPLCQRGRRCH